MTAHELARLLLEGPDLRVVVALECGYDDPKLAFGTVELNANDDCNSAYFGRHESLGPEQVVQIKGRVHEPEGWV